MFNVLQQLQTIQNERFATVTDNSVFGAKTAAEGLRDSIFLYEGAEAAVKQEGYNTLEGDHAAGGRKSESKTYADQYLADIKRQVGEVTEELRDAGEIGEMDMGSMQFAKNAATVEKIMKVVGKADKITKTTTPNPLEKTIEGAKPARKKKTSKALQRFDSEVW